MAILGSAEILLFLFGSVLVGAYASWLLSKKNLADMTDEIEELNQRLENANRLLSMQGRRDNHRAPSPARSSAPPTAPDHLTRPEFSSSDSVPGRSQSRVSRRFAIPLLAAAVLLILILSLSFYYIEPGYVGLKKHKGRYLTDEVMPGPHFKIPFWQHIDAFDVRLKVLNFAENPENSPDPLTIKSQPILVKDANGLEATIEMGLQYRIEPEMAGDIAAKYGTDLVANLVRPTLTDALRKTFTHYSSLTQFINNEKDQQELPGTLSEALSSLQEEGLHIFALEFRSVSVPRKTRERSEQAVQTSSQSPKLEPPTPPVEKRSIQVSKTAPREIEKEIKGKSLEQTIQASSRQQTVQHSTPLTDEKAVPAESLSAEKNEQENHGLKAEIYFCRDLERDKDRKGRLEYKLIGHAERFSKEVGKIICFTRIQGALEETVIQHRWFWKNKLMGEVRLAVRSKDWRTYSKFTISPQLVGTWRVDVTQRDGTLIGRKNFVIE
jgi:hypothetical protein